MFAWIFIALCGLSLADAQTVTTHATGKPIIPTDPGILTTTAPSSMADAPKSSSAATTDAPTSSAATTAAPTTSAPTTAAPTTAAQTANNDNQTKVAIKKEDHDQNQDVVGTLESKCNPCKNGGTLTEDLVCDCKPGYFGRKCDKTDCISNPCKNGGIFVGENLACVCEPGYDGIKCESAVLPGFP